LLKNKDFMKKTKLVNAIVIIGLVGFCGSSFSAEDSPSEKASPSKEKIQTRFKKSIFQLGESIEKMGNQIEKAADKNKKVLKKQLSDLKIQEKEIKKDLHKLETNTGTAWENLKSGLEKALGELRRGVKKAKASLGGEKD